MLTNIQTTLWGRMMRYMNYKPGWWASYFIYCMIPICIYAWYLSTRRCSEEVTEKGEESPVFARKHESLLGT